MEALFWIAIAALLVSMSMAFAVTFLLLCYDFRKGQNLFLACFTLLIGIWAMSSVIVRLELGLGSGDTFLPFASSAISRTSANVFLLLFASRYVNKKRRLYDGISIMVLLAIILSVIIPTSGTLLSRPRLIDGFIITYDISLVGHAIGTLLLIPLFISLWLFLSLKEKREYREPQLAAGVLFLIIGYYLGGILLLPMPFAVFSNTLGVMIIGGILIKKQIFNPIKVQNEALKKELDERKRVKRALVSSEKRFQALIENSFDGIVVINKDRGLGYTSPANRRILGYGPEDRGEDILFTMVHPDHLPLMMKNLQKAMDNPGRVVDETYKMRHKDGSWKWIESQMNNLLDDPHINGIVLNFRDVTEEKESEKRLRSSEKRNRKVIDLSPFPISIYNTHGNFIDINPAMVRFSGYNRKDLMGKNLQDIVARDSLPSVYDALENTSRGKKIPPQTLRFKTKSGDVRIMDIALTPIMKADNVRSILAIGRDVTEQTEAEEQLERAYERLKEIDGMRSDFIDVAAHEIRTPLSAVKAYLDLMDSGQIGKFTGKERNYLKEARTNIEDLNSLVTEMLDYTRTGVQMLDIPTEEKDLTEIARGSAESFTQLLGLQNISLSINSLGETLAYVDADMMAKVFNNLIGNALKYSPKGGKITITVTEKKDLIEVAVEDTGIGINKEDIPYIFERFYMGSATLTRDKDRLGLGLPITRSIVEGHGGNIWAKSEKDNGSTFYFTIPKEHRRDMPE